MSLEFIRGYLAELDATLRALPHEQIAGIIDAIRDVRDRDAQLFVVGNGGSAATASHFAVDLGKGASIGAERRFRVLSLTDNVPWITALGNDLSYADVFVEQLIGLYRPGDLLFAISGSGNSPNVLRAVAWANQCGAPTVGLTGFDGGKLARLARYSLLMDNNVKPQVEDIHMTVCHALAVAMRARIAELPPLTQAVGILSPQYAFSAGS
jgi:D-sedoheptulose 7-phosphate isomerase